MAQKKAQPTTSTEHVPAGEHGKGFPPFDATTFASQLIWLALTFAVLYLLMSRIALPRVGAVLEHRRQRMAGDIAEAERLKGESDAAIAAYQKALADARGRAQALANEAREQQAAAAEAERKALDVRLNARIAEAEKAIAATRESAMTNVRVIAVEAAGAIVERLIGTTPPERGVADAVAEVLKR
jgi:F-type H+-transporting ATPase subunit b